MHYCFHSTLGTARGFTVIAHEVLTQEITCGEELIWATPALTGLRQVYGGQKAGKKLLAWLGALSWFRLQLCSGLWSLMRPQTLLGSFGSSPGLLTYGPDKDLTLQDKELFRGI